MNVIKFINNSLLFKKLILQKNTDLIQININYLKHFSVLGKIGTIKKNTCHMPYSVV
jgi:hypothetical protein